jgi:hypothetical protein
MLHRDLAFPSGFNRLFCQPCSSVTHVATSSNVHTEVVCTLCFVCWKLERSRFSVWCVFPCLKCVKMRHGLSCWTLDKLSTPCFMLALQVTGFVAGGLTPTKARNYDCWPGGLLAFSNALLARQASIICAACGPSLLIDPAESMIHVPTSRFCQLALNSSCSGRFMTS